jgi:hypothetical protein
MRYGGRGTSLSTSICKTSGASTRYAGREIIDVSRGGSKFPGTGDINVLA